MHNTMECSSRFDHTLLHVYALIQEEMSISPFIANKGMFRTLCLVENREKLRKLLYMSQPNSQGSYL